MRLGGWHSSNNSVEGCVPRVAGLDGDAAFLDVNSIGSGLKRQRLNDLCPNLLRSTGQFGAGSHRRHLKLTPVRFIPIFLETRMRFTEITSQAGATELTD
jgi:hypothetical protein